MASLGALARAGRGALRAEAQRGKIYVGGIGNLRENLLMRGALDQGVPLAYF